jgi:hypothetical protein
MADFDRRTVNYTTDEGQDIAIQVVYFNNVAIDPDTRLEIGGFDSTNDCGLITPRRRLKPRQVTVEAEDDNGDLKELDVYVKTKSAYQALIDDPESPSTGKVVKYQGEASSICTPSNNN